MKIDVAGFVSPGWEPLRETFVAAWDTIEVGASVCIQVDGITVVDLWGGFQDREMSRPWTEDTIVCVYSSTKGLAALAIAVLYDEGLIDYEAPVAKYWPEFAAAGKGAITVAQLLSHQAGLSGLETPVSIADLYDWERMIGLLESQAPLWEPGTAAGYHAVTWGYFPGELVRRVTGMTLGQFCREKITGPADADFYLGLNDAEIDRCAELIGPNHARVQPGVDGGAPAAPPSRLNKLAFNNPPIRPFKDACSAEWRRAEIAASNGHANARGLARVYGAAIGGKLVGKDALQAANRVEVDSQVDLVTGGILRRSRGFILNTDNNYGPNPLSFGHAGAGGSLGFADPDAGVSFGYAMNQMQPGTPPVSRAGRLVRTLYELL